MLTSFWLKKLDVVLFSKQVSFYIRIQLGLQVVCDVSIVGAIITDFTDVRK